MRRPMLPLPPPLLRLRPRGTLRTVHTARNLLSLRAVHTAGGEEDRGGRGEGGRVHRPMLPLILLSVPPRGRSAAPLRTAHTMIRWKVQGVGCRV